MRKAWATTKLKAYGHKPQWIKGRSNQLAAESLAALKAINLHFHDLRAEFGSRLVDSGSTLVEARDLYGHADSKQTDTYLRSRSSALVKAIERKEAHEREQARARQAARDNPSHTDIECGNDESAAVDGSESAEVVKH